MLEDDVVVAFLRTVANTSDTGRYNRRKGKRSRDDQDRRGKRDSRESRLSEHRSAAEGSGDRAIENPREDSEVEQIRFTVSPS